MSAYNALSQLVAGGGQLATTLQGNPTLVQLLDVQGNTLVQFDATLQENYQHRVQPTSFPVEDGSSVTDHLVRSPRTLSMTAMISDTPFTGLQKFSSSSISTSITAPMGVIGTATAYATWQTGQGSARPSVDAYAKLQRMLTGNPNASPPTPPAIFTAQTAIGQFDNMVLTSLSVPRDPDTGGALIFSLEMTEIVIVTTQSIDVLSVSAVPTLASGKKALGAKEAELKQKEGLFSQYRLSGGRAVSENLSPL